MKKQLFLLVALLVILAATACSDSKNTTKNAETPAAEESAQAPANAAKSAVPSDRILSQLDPSGIELDAEQRAKLDEISSKYDFSSTTDRTARKQLIQQYQNEIMNSVFTEDQKAAFLQYQESRKAQREERKQ